MGTPPGGFVHLEADQYRIERGDQSFTLIMDGPPLVVGCHDFQSSLPYERFADEADLVEQTTHLLAEDKIVGWFHGRMEFGPRALGARSILGDPRSARTGASGRGRGRGSSSSGRAGARPGS